MFCVEEHKYVYSTRIYIGALIPHVYIGTLATHPHLHTHIYTYIYYLEILIDFSALNAPFKEIDIVNCTLE